MAHFAIVGANRGIGLEIARQLKARGDRVTATSRRPAPELEAVGCRVVTGIDVGDPDSLPPFVEAIATDRIDGLFVVAGILRRVTLDALDWAEIRREFEVNALGPLRVVSAVRPHLAKGAKIGLVTSRMGSIADNTSGSHYAYRMSKAALNMAGRSLAHDLRSDGVSVVLLHPGFVRTDMTGGRGAIDVDEAARGLIARLDELTLDTSGTFRHQDGQTLPW